MIIEFANSAEYWNNRYASARREGRLEDAVVAARNALRLDDCFDNRMDYADLLSELHLARWSASVCLHGARGGTLDEQLEWLELMMSNCSREAAYGSAMYYQMQLMIKQHGEENAAELGQDLMDFVQSLADEPTEPADPLQFAEDAHAQENEQLHDEMFEAFNEDDYATVCRLWHRAHPDYPFYREMLFMAGYSYAKLGENDEARRLLWQLYELHGHDARLLYYIDELAGGMRDDEMAQALSAVPDDDNADNLSMAGVCAARHGLYVDALRYARRAMQLCPAEPTYILRVATVYARMGRTKDACELQRHAVALYPDFLPEGLADWAMPTDVDLHFPFLPNALGAYLWDTVAPAMGGAQFAQRMQTDRAFRSAVRFLLTEYDQDVRQTIDLVKEVTTWQTPEGIAFWRDILREPALHNVVQFHLTFALLDVVRRGRVSITNAYVAGEWTLRVPPSYDDYNHQMRRIYAKAYLYMVSANKHNELRLSRMAEQLYCYLPHEQYYQANLMGYALVHAGGIVDKGRLDAVVAQNGWDAELMMRYVDLVRQALKNK